MDNSPVYLCWFIYTLCKASILGIHSLMNDGQTLLDTQIHTVCALQEDVAVQRPVMHECMLVSVARCTFGHINAEISLLILLNINISTKQSLKTALRPCTIQKYYAFTWFCLFWFLYRKPQKGIAIMWHIAGIEIIMIQKAAQLCILSILMTVLYNTMNTNLNMHAVGTK